MIDRNGMTEEEWDQIVDERRLFRFALGFRRALRMIGFALFLTFSGPDACERCDGPACEPLRCELTTCR